MIKEINPHKLIKVEIMETITMTGQVTVLFKFYIKVTLLSYPR